MAIGDSGRAVRNTTGDEKPKEFASRVGAHVHRGTPESTVGGPGCTMAPGASQSGSSGTSPYGGGGDEA